MCPFIIDITSDETYLYCFTGGMLKVTLWPHNVLTKQEIVT